MYGKLFTPILSIVKYNVANQIVTQTQRQKMLVARNRAILLLFLESDIRLEKLTRLRLEDIELQRQRAVLVHMISDTSPTGCVN